MNQFLAKKDFICRTCMDTRKLLPILDTAFANIVTSVLLASTVEVYVKKDDELPMNICETCLYELLSFYRFKTQCLTNQKIMSTTLIQLKEAKLLEKSAKLIGLEHSYATKYEEIKVVNCNEIRHTEGTNRETIESLEMKTEDKVIPDEEMKNVDLPAEDLNLTRVVDLERFIQNNSSNNVNCRMTAKVTEKNSLTPRLCKTCWLIFSSFSHLDTHQKVFKHGQYNQIACEHCKKRLPKYEFEKRKLSYDKEKLYDCSYCFKYSASFRQFECVFKSPERRLVYFSCFCGQQFNTFIELKKHEKRHYNVGK